LLVRHDKIARELAGKRRSLGVSLEAERENKVLGFAQSQGESDKRREQIGAFNALPNTKASLVLQNEIAALEEERDNIRLQLQYGGYQEG
jgi:hypothetical protein